MTGRFIFIDNISGIMIIYMIYSHIAQISAMDMTDEYQILLKVFFCFMTWFFFKAGLLFTPPSKR